MRKVVVLSLFTLLLSAPGVAQNVDIEALSGLQFNFSNPGARAMGMGGAFLGLADDASAAESNPAGLTILRTPEVSIEGRNFEIIQQFNTTGAFPDIQREGFSIHSDRVELSFASFVYPMGNGVIAGYYHQPLKVEGEVNALTDTFLGIPFFRQTPVYYQPIGNPPGSEGPVSLDRCIDIINQTGDPFACQQWDMLPFVTSVNTQMRTAGLSLAYKFGPLSLGGSVRYQTFESLASTFRVSTDAFRVTHQVVQATFDGSDFTEESDTTFTVGFKWDLRSNLSLGGVYKQGAEFNTHVFEDFQDGQGFRLLSDQTTFHVPDVYGLGISYRPIPLLTINVDAVEVKYSNLTDNFQSIFPEVAILGQNAYETKDVTEIHAGFEYFFTTTIPFAIRGGWWRDPAHAMKYVGPLTCTDPEVAEQDRYHCAAGRTATSILFPGSEDQDHWTIGIGLAWPRFQLDAAYDRSDNFKVGSLSAVYRF
jgi:long-chain fatty acid transport protein